MPGLGEELRAAREARHLSLSDVSEQIHIRTVYLQSLEDEDWSAIAAPVYVRGFIRTYARFLGVPSEQAVAFFNESIGPSAAKPGEQIVTAPRRWRPSIWLWIAAAAAVILVAFVGYNYLQLEQQGGPAQTAAGNGAGTHAAPAPGATVAGLPLPVKHRKYANATLEVRITQASWLLVKIDGKQQLEGILGPGTLRQFHGNTAQIRAGNAGGVHLAVNGKPLGSMGPSGAVVDRTIGLGAPE